MSNPNIDPNIDPTFDRDEDHVRSLTPKQLDLLTAGLEYFENERVHRAVNATATERAHTLYQASW